MRVPAVLLVVVGGVVATVGCAPEEPAEAEILFGVSGSMSTRLLPGKRWCLLQEP